MLYIHTTWLWYSSEYNNYTYWLVTDLSTYSICLPSNVHHRKISPAMWNTYITEAIQLYMYSTYITFCDQVATRSIVENTIYCIEHSITNFESISYHMIKNTGQPIASVDWVIVCSLIVLRNKHLNNMRPSMNSVKKTKTKICWTSGTAITTKQQITVIIQSQTIYQPCDVLVFGPTKQKVRKAMKHVLNTDKRPSILMSCDELHNAMHDMRPKDIVQCWMSIAHQTIWPSMNWKGNQLVHYSNEVDQHRYQPNLNITTLEILW